MKPKLFASSVALRLTCRCLVVTLATGLLANRGTHERAALAAAYPPPEVHAAEASPLLPAQSPVILQGGLHAPRFDEVPQPRLPSIERPQRPTEAQIAALIAPDAIVASVADATNRDSTQSADALPNLYPAKPSNWTNGPIVISSQTGTTANGELRADASAYVDWAIYNAGASISASFRTCLWMDDAWLKCWTSEGLPSGYVGYVLDWKGRHIPGHRTWREPQRHLCGYESVTAV